MTILNILRVASDPASVRRGNNKSSKSNNHQSNNISHQSKNNKINNIHRSNNNNQSINNNKNKNKTTTTTTIDHTREYCSRFLSMGSSMASAKLMAFMSGTPPPRCLFVYISLR